ncbi:MAG: glycerophosphodiester phosphodiesterase [Gammaproteobacteria bacterium]|nr:glycerophosphodiester phosphodiesterase [Gammaproteobacteria bacterium]
MSNLSLKLGSIIGHRGVAALAPENTIESFALAHHYGLKSVEFDMVLSADGEAFVFHDLTLNRTTNGRGEIGRMTSSYIKTLDAGSWFSSKFSEAKVPTLRETLVWLVDRQMNANIEIKPCTGFTYDTTMAMLSHLDELWPKSASQPLISSFDIDALRLCKKEQPGLPLAYLMDHWRPEEIAVAKSLNCVAINLNCLIATSRRIKMLKKRGFKVYVYTVNYQFLIKKYLAWGATGVFSDYPVLLK